MLLSVGSKPHKGSITTVEQQSENALWGGKDGFQVHPTELFGQSPPKTCMRTGYTVLSTKAISASEQRKQYHIQVPCSLSILCPIGSHKVNSCKVRPQFSLRRKFGTLLFQYLLTGLGVSNLLVSLGHTGSRVVLGHKTTLTNTKKNCWVKKDFK